MDSITKSFVFAAGEDGRKGGGYVTGAKSRIPKDWSI